MDLWHIEFLGNSLADWLFAIGLVAGTSILIKVIGIILRKQISRESESAHLRFVDVFKVLYRKTIVPIAYFVALYYALQVLKLPEKTAKLVNTCMLIATTFWIIHGITAILGFIIRKFVQSKYGIDADAKQSRGIIILVKIVIWIAGTVFLIDNLGYDVNGIITGLGIGGVAIALAAQAILGDLFSYFGIFFDKPFVVGDFLIVDDKLGTVEHIGIKTTRIRSLSGEQLVFSNSDLTNSRIHNMQKLERRRTVYTFRVDLLTPAEKLAIIPEKIKQIILNEPGTLFDRVHFAGIGDYAFEFEFVYFSLSPEYAHMMDKKQNISLAILKMLKEENVQLAYPTHKLYNNVKTYDTPGSE